MLKVNGELKKNYIITIILSIGIIVNLGVSIYLYSQINSINSNITGVQTEVKSIQSKRDGIISKIKDSEKKLDSIQRENSKFSR